MPSTQTMCSIACSRIRICEGRSALPYSAQRTDDLRYSPRETLTVASELDNNRQELARLARSEVILSAVAGVLCADKSLSCDTDRHGQSSIAWASIGDNHVAAGVRRIPGRAIAEMAARHQGSQ